MASTDDWVAHAPLRLHSRIVTGANPLLDKFERYRLNGAHQPINLTHESNCTTTAATTLVK
jgi:hypothetical protein